LQVIAKFILDLTIQLRPFSEGPDTTKDAHTSPHAKRRIA
jgi:hypothetical protein